MPVLLFFETQIVHAKIINTHPQKTHLTSLIIISPYHAYIFEKKHQIARFDRWKDPECVIEAFKLARKEVDCTLVLLGDIAPMTPRVPWSISPARKA
jgi:hypothetical protein